MNQKTKAYFQLHIAVFLFGFTAILGDLIQLSTLPLVWWRVLLTTFSLIFIIPVIPLLKSMGSKKLLQYAGIGVIVALHWLCFYGSIKLANASVALVCMATASFFTSIIEPFLLKTKFKWLDIILGLLIIPGMMLVVNNIHTDMLLGVYVGLMSSFLAALFACLNKMFIQDASPLSITFIEMGSATIFLSILLPFFIIGDGDYSFWPEKSDWFYLIILVLLCTTLAYVLALKSLQYLSAFTSNLVVNLEPVYGILLAIPLLHEHKELGSNFYWGVGLIVLVVAIYPFLDRFFYKN